MTVYIEYVLIDNLVIDYLLLKATLSLTGINYKKGRLFLCAIFGAMVALIYPLIKIKTISTLIRFLCGFILTAGAVKYASKKSYLINTAVFFLFTFLTGGAIIGIFTLFNMDYSAEYSIALMFIPVYFILRAITEVIKYIYRRKDVVSLTYSIFITIFGKTVSCKGFLDTGNGLYDGDNPVIVCGKRFFLDLIGNNFHRAKLKKIVVNTVSGKTENFAVTLDELKIYIGDEPNIFNNVTLCVASAGVGEGYDVILHPALLEGIYDKTNAVKVEKIS